jgi:hypothetical protein
MRKFPFIIFIIFLFISCSYSDQISRQISGIPGTSGSSGTDFAKNSCLSTIPKSERLHHTLVSCDGGNGYPKNPRQRSSIRIGGSEFIGGFSQVTANRQDAFLYKKTGSKLDWCFYYDRSSADTRTELLAGSGQGAELFAAFTTDGGNSSFRASRNAVQASYGRGGGPKITYLARIDINTGAVCQASFLGARLNDGKTNTLSPSKLSVGKSTVFFEGKTAYDGGKANDSLSPGKVCQSGSQRTITLPYNLTRNNLYKPDCQ